MTNKGSDGGYPTQRHLVGIRPVDSVSLFVRATIQCMEACASTAALKALGARLKREEMTTEEKKMLRMCYKTRLEDITILNGELL